MASQIQTAMGTTGKGDIDELLRGNSYWEIK